MGQIKNFDLQKEIELQGTSVAIGNSIVSVHSTEPYNIIGYGAEKNDRLPMVYIDIDGNDNTFSSSSATLSLPSTTEKIAFAGLYWTATYPYEEGEMVKGNTEYLYVEKTKRKETYHQILFKLPEGNYQTVRGEILTDQVDSIAKPYVCFADVTSHLQKLTIPSGEYTVANMRATQGHLLGGSAGGWLLYIIYEDKSLPRSKISIYSGCRPVVKGGHLFPLNSYNSTNTSTSKIVFGALEGDERLKTDEVYLRFKSGKQSALSNIGRDQRNFFNSSITFNDSIMMQRKPNSKNTLGFDIATISPSSEEKTEKGVLEKVTQIDFKTVRDTYFLFFVSVENLMTD
ncbi:hypothetical protein HX109_12850 [Galbibacter sp. BG1]|uniref:hypothetical protein n=1 Tax=Galbibacter sp. BG1 TaxID=1170699 RepID=UPI0015BB42F0|nr:hypothetical protein [Galbibacter sp. BG1]QLE02401.1 hypothetical protein HX109_12850 [Galbibacter sp. BG1]